MRYRKLAHPPPTILFAALLAGLPGGTAAAQCRDYEADFNATRFEQSRANRWVTAVREAVPDDENHECYTQLDAAASGLERADTTCGLWWAPLMSIPQQDWGWTDVPNREETEGDAAILVASIYQMPALAAELGVTLVWDLREIMTHEGSHA